jgi:hypothetical protein
VGVTDSFRMAALIRVSKRSRQEVFKAVRAYLQDPSKNIDAAGRLMARSFPGQAWGQARCNSAILTVTNL